MNTCHLAILSTPLADLPEPVLRDLARWLAGVWFLLAGCWFALFHLIVASWAWEHGVVPTTTVFVLHAFVERPRANTTF